LFYFCIVVLYKLIAFYKQKQRKTFLKHILCSFSNQLWITFCDQIHMPSRITISCMG